MLIQVNAQPFRIARIESIDGSTERCVFNSFMMRALRLSAGAGFSMCFLSLTNSESHTQSRVAYRSA
jgi:hypothetical protein